MNRASTMKSKLLKYIKDRFSEYPELQLIISNIGWLFGDRFFKMTIGLIIGAWFMRYLGTKNYGLFAYAQAFSAIFAPITTLGLQQITLREIIKEPSQDYKILGTSLFLRFIGSTLSLILSTIAITLFRPDNSLVLYMVILLSVSSIIDSMEIIQGWFAAKVLSKFPILVDNAIFVFGTILKIILILSHASLLSFVWAILFTNIARCFAFIWLYNRKIGNISLLQINFKLAKNMLKDGLPMIFGGIAIMLYHHIDKIMIGNMLSDEAVGVYAAALRISTLWIFIPVAIIQSTYPSILKLKANNEKLYDIRIQKLFNLMVIISIGLSLLITVSSQWIVLILLGSAYKDAVSVIVIHVWTGIFTALSMTNGQFLIADNYQHITLFCTLLILPVNIGLNHLLIPTMGPQGAALATLISIVARFSLFALFPKARKLFFMQLKSLSLSFLFTYFIMKDKSEK